LKIRVFVLWGDRLPTTTVTQQNILCYENCNSMTGVMPPNYLSHENRTLYHQHTQIITEVDVKLNKWHITIEKLYRKRTETEQNFKKNDPTVGSNREPKTQEARAFPLCQQATRWKWSKASI